MRKIHLVGSVPLANASEVFATVSDVLSDRITRIPDGETGKRTGWMRWQEHVFAGDPQFEKAATSSVTHAAGFTFQNYRLREGVDRDAFTLNALGYSEAAIGSYAEFAALKKQGTIAADVRFQVCIPTPMGQLWSYVVRDDHAPVERALYARYITEIKEILAVVPAGELAIQWDAPHDMLTLEGAREFGVDYSRQSLLKRWALLASHIPAETQLGFHLCYGDSGRKHAVEPKDTGLMVSYSNELAATIGHDVSFIHMPVPRERGDEAFYAPLRDLAVPGDFDLFLGLVHLSDGVEGGRQRMRSARKAREDFGIATECGFGRRPPETVPELLRLHADLADGG